MENGSGLAKCTTLGGLELYMSTPTSKSGPARLKRDLNGSKAKEYECPKSGTNMNPFLHITCSALQSPGRSSLRGSCGRSGDSQADSGLISDDAARG